MAENLMNVLRILQDPSLNSVALGNANIAHDAAREEAESAVEAQKQNVKIEINPSRGTLSMKDVPMQTGVDVEKAVQPHKQLIEMLSAGGDDLIDDSGDLGFMEAFRGSRKLGGGLIDAIVDGIRAKTGSLTEESARKQLRDLQLAQELKRLDAVNPYVQQARGEREFGFRVNQEERVRENQARDDERVRQNQDLLEQNRIRDDRRAQFTSVIGSDLSRFDSIEQMYAALGFEPTEAEAVNLRTKFASDQKKAVSAEEDRQLINARRRDLIEGGESPKLEKPTTTIDDETLISMWNSNSADPIAVRRETIRRANLYQSKAKTNARDLAKFRAELEGEKSKGLKQQNPATIKSLEAQISNLVEERQDLFAKWDPLLKRLGRTRVRRGGQQAAPENSGPLKPTGNGEFVYTR